jgi:hypothetical protein
LQPSWEHWLVGFVQSLSAHRCATRSKERS